MLFYFTFFFFFLIYFFFFIFFFFSSRRRHTRFDCDWSSDVCSSDLDLPCIRIELDEQWQYVGCHAGRMMQKEKGRGDFWLWAAIDADTKLVFSHKIGKRDWKTGYAFVGDVRERVKGPVQIATDQLPAYAGHIRMHFGYEGYSYGTETKIFGEPHLPDGTLARLGRNEGVRKMETVERAAVVGSPDLE